MGTQESVSVGGEKLLWLFPDDIDSQGEEVHFEELQMLTSKNGHPWPVYLVHRKKDNDVRRVSGWSLVSKEKYKAEELLYKDFILVRQGTRIRLIKPEAVLVAA